MMGTSKFASIWVSGLMHKVLFGEPQLLMT